MGEYSKKTAMPISAKELFAWHERNGALKRLLPPWKHVTVIRDDHNIIPGSEVHLKVKKGPLSLLWVAQYTEYNPPVEFVDIQAKGPFKKWIHRHRMVPIDESHSELEEQISFTTSFNIGKRLALQEIDRIFQYRHDLLQRDFQVQQELPAVPMSVAVTGASGMVGSALTAFLQSAGHRVIPIVRGKPSKGEIGWNPTAGTIDQNELEKVDVVVNLAGENIGSGRWTREKKKRIRESRIKGTKLLVDTFNQLKHPPKAFLSASAVGYYGNNMTTASTELGSPGSGFLASVCADWEAEANRFKAGRCVTLRLGVVLSSSGGALRKMLIPFLLGIGGVIGSGNQSLSWIALDDLVYAIYRIIIDDRLSGPINLCSPNCVTNYELTKTLGKVLHRPTILPIPAFAAKMVFGEMADESILSSCLAIPQALQECKHDFYYAHLEDALRHTLGRKI